MILAELFRAATLKEYFIKPKAKVKGQSVNFKKKETLTQGLLRR